MSAFQPKWKVRFQVQVSVVQSKPFGPHCIVLFFRLRLNFVRGTAHSQLFSGKFLSRFRQRRNGHIEHAKTIGDVHLVL